jgi:outer membrane protein OmpA-like peptidoglycan-associated protein
MAGIRASAARTNSTSTLDFSTDSNREIIMLFSKLILPAAILATLTGCATRTYVDESIARLEARQNNHEEQISELTASSSQALERANDAGVLARGKFLYSVVLTDDGVTFGSDDTALTPQGEQRLAALADRLKSENQNVYLEIQGHTDATGPVDYNERLGLQRAESVRRYLHTQGVAMNRMATISYGEEMPAAPNETAEGRANNRRVAIVVLD